MPPVELQLAEITAPCARYDIDVTGEIPSIPGGREKSAWVLVRKHTEALDVLLLSIPNEGLSREAVKEAVDATARRVISRRSSCADLGVDGPAFLVSRRQVLESAPEITVVVPTRERPEGLMRCLKSLLALNYPDFKVIVVDSGPISNQTRDIVSALDSEKVHYVLEKHPGAARARNTGLHSVTSEVVAFVDDDVVVDEDWLSEIARGFSRGGDVDCVTGILVPAELETDPQVWFEQYGGHGKHRGFEPATFSTKRVPKADPLYPLPPFGSGGNMAFRTERLLSIGGFDSCLGVGTPCPGGEETRAFADILLSGGTIAYQPTAIGNHYHRRLFEELRKQMYGYGAGVTGFYLSILLSKPSCIVSVMRIIPKALRDLKPTSGERGKGLPNNFPKDLIRQNTKGLVLGALEYIRSVRKDNQLMSRSTE